MRKLLALLTVCGIVVACDSRNISGAAPFTAELGAYAMRTSNGVVLPVPLSPVSPNTTRSLVADSLVLTSGGNIRESRYTVTTNTAVTPNTTSKSSSTLTGRYTITRDSLHVPTEFQSPAGVPYVLGKFTTDTIRLTDSQGFVYVFSRR